MRIAGFPLRIVGRDQIGNRRAGGNPMALMPSPEAVIRYYVAGLGRTVVAAGGALAATTGPLTRPFHAERLVVPSDVAGAFSITNISSGSDSVVVSAPGVGIPARCFIEDGIEIGLDFPDTIAGTPINVTGTNISGAAQTFEGAVLGFAAVVG